MPSIEGFLLSEIRQNAFLHAKTPFLIPLNYQALSFIYFFNQSKLRGKQMNANENWVQGYLSRKQTADYMGVSIPTIDRWAKNGVLKPIKLGGTVRYSKAELDQLQTER